MIILRIYVTNKTQRAIKAIEDLKAILEADFKDQFSLEIIDVLKDPQMTLEDNIFATPTVINLLSSPHRRLIGDLSDKEKVLKGLGLLN